MTLAPNTIEEQMKELKSQYKHAANIISELNILVAERNKDVEKYERELNRQRQVITDLECRLAAANSPVGECKCKGGCHEPNL